jgi:hypothetical protein
MGVGDPDGVWDRVAAEVAAPGRHWRDTVDDARLETLAGQIDAIVDRFLREVWARHRASIETLKRDSNRRDVQLGNSGVLFTAGYGDGSAFKFPIGSGVFQLCLDGRWAYKLETGDDYTGTTCIFGYGDGKDELFAEPQAYMGINVAPDKLDEETVRPLVRCVQADW